VNVIETLRGPVFIAEETERIDFRPVFSQVRAFQQGALLDASVDGAGIVGIEGNEFSVRDVRRSRKRPIRSAGDRDRRCKISGLVPFRHKRAACPLP
jgi:hypothetical protein